ncbi:tetratricopeptide repeat protein [Amycolatopsis echigonensis]|uniref:Tetratricopeptide repeat protein n=1 Tax=Amycolatopsis echigonensis TaxID=2576905 RepID=A0A2N3WJH4_9PSEU|nr:tetratricopeptide repeat protein [Amycolatopsis niigatensis]PKV94015.1 tetratricopeptide repeat protein [Amycolatopsis niigatensis]
MTAQVESAALRLLHAVHERVQAYTDRYDPSGILDPHIVVEAEELENLGQQAWPNHVPFEVAGTLFNVYWFRYTLLPLDEASERQAMDHLWDALRWYTVLIKMKGVEPDGRMHDVISFDLPDSERAIRWLDDDQGLAELLAAARKPINRFVSERARSGIAADGALAAVDALVAAAGELPSTGMPTVVQVVTWFHWCRFKVIGEDEILRLAHLRMAIDGFRVLSRLDPLLVTVQLRPLITRDPSKGYGPAWWNEHALMLLKALDFEHRPRDLDIAIELLRKTVAAVGDCSRHVLSNAFSRLGNALRMRFERTGRPEDIDDSIAAARNALATLPDGHPFLAGLLSNLAGALRTKFDHVGAMNILDESIALGRRALSVEPKGHRDASVFRMNLGTSLLVRSHYTKSLEDINEAVQWYRDAVKAAQNEYVRRLFCTSVLGGALHERYLSTAKQDDLDEAVMLGSAASRSFPANHPVRASVLVRYGNALTAQFAATGDLEYLNTSINAYHEALSATTVGDYQRVTCLSNLCWALIERYGRTSDLDDLDLSYALAEQLIDHIPAGDPQMTQALLRMASIKFECVKVNRLSITTQDVIDTLQKAMTLKSAPSEDLFQAARALGDLVSSVGKSSISTNWEVGVNAYQVAVELLPRFAWRGLDRASSQQALKVSRGMASSAAGLLLSGGCANDALEILERGRAVMWSQLLQSRADLSGLASVAPELAKRLVTTRNELDSSSLDTKDVLDSNANPNE